MPRDRTEMRKPLTPLDRPIGEIFCPSTRRLARSAEQYLREKGFCAHLFCCVCQDNLVESSSLLHGERSRPSGMQSPPELPELVVGKHPREGADWNGDRRREGRIRGEEDGGCIAGVCGYVNEIRSALGASSRQKMEKKPRRHRAQSGQTDRRESIIG